VFQVFELIHVIFIIRSQDFTVFVHNKFVVRKKVIISLLTSFGTNPNSVIYLLLPPLPSQNHLK
jgi:hypothetical protein